MPAMPGYVKIGFPQAEEPGTAVMRSEMERGIAKQRRMAADVVVKQETTLYFDTKQNSIDFETWVRTDIDAGATFFDWVDLRTGVTVQARIVEGKLGALTPSTVNWAYSQRKVTLEWVRAAI